jgi:hypothetical protein
VLTSVESVEQTATQSTVNDNVNDNVNVNVNDNVSDSVKVKVKEIIKVDHLEIKNIFNSVCINLPKIKEIVKTIYLDFDDGKTTITNCYGVTITYPENLKYNVMNNHEPINILAVAKVYYMKNLDEYVKKHIDEFYAINKKFIEFEERKNGK